MSLCPDLPFVFPHRASVRTGSFRRSWVQPELTEENWDHAGVLYYDEAGVVMYGTVLRFEQHHETKWQIDRKPYRDGRFGRSTWDRLPTRSEAIEALMAEVHTSRERFEPVPREEWPQDRDSSWIIASRPSRSVR